MKKPNLFIVGAPKAGTSFLFEKLSGHPELFFPKIKELNYFSYDELIATSYYKDFKVGSLLKYEKQYSDATTEKYLVDGSVSYFAFTNVAKKIKEYNPDTKIIIILRDPVERAFSHYLMDKRMGYADKTFQSYINGRESLPAHFLQYIGNSQYKTNCEVYITLFGTENVFIMKLDSLKEDLDKLYAFLAIENIAIETTERVNENKEAKNKIARFFQKNRNITERIKRFVPKSLINWGNKKLYGAAKKNEMTADERAFLTNELEEDINYFNNL